MKCKVCKQVKDTTELEVRLTYCNIFKEGSAYPEKYHLAEVCEDCLHNFYLIVTKLLGEDSLAVMDYEKRRPVKIYEDEEELNEEERKV